MQGSTVVDQYQKHFVRDVQANPLLICFDPKVADSMQAHVQCWHVVLRSGELRQPEDLHDSEQHQDSVKKKSAQLFFFLPGYTYNYLIRRETQESRTIKGTCKEITSQARSGNRKQLVVYSLPTSVRNSRYLVYDALPEMVFIVYSSKQGDRVGDYVDPGECWISKIWVNFLQQFRQISKALPQGGASSLFSETLPFDFLGGSSAS